MARLQRTHRNMQPVRDALDFVIVNNKLHDEFKRAEIKSVYSYLRLNELLKLYLRCHPHLSGCVVKKYGHTYLRLLSERVDDLCQWIYQLRETFHTEQGQNVFERCDTNFPNCILVYYINY